MAKVIPITRALFSASLAGILRLPFRPQVVVAEHRLCEWLERARGIFGSSLTRDELADVGLGDAVPEAKPYSSAELTRFLEATRS